MVLVPEAALCHMRELVSVHDRALGEQFARQDISSSEDPGATES
jgi:hypothetical protein